MMKGFFNIDQNQVPYKSQKGVHSCVSCGLYKKVNSPRLKPYGNFKKRILIVGEAPGQEEDSAGKPWQGKAGKALQAKLSDLGIDIFEDCLSLNAVNCRPVDRFGTNRTPTEFEVACCRQRIIDVIIRKKPNVILLLGNAAVSSIIGYRWKRDLGGITKWQGWKIPDRDFSCWLCPTFHPSFVIRQEQQNEVEVIWENDLANAIKLAKNPFPEFKEEADQVQIAENIEDILPELRKMRLLALDIETTGIKPYNRAVHEILSISFCGEDDRAYVIPFPTKRSSIARLKKLLENPKIGKIAANMKFEDTWLNILHGIQVQNWTFDTMQATHILDNRPGITSLKFQAFVQFGVLGYDNEISSYMKAADVNSVNKLPELMQDSIMRNKLLLYNGIDSLMTYKLAMQQMAILNMQKV